MTMDRLVATETFVRIMTTVDNASTSLSEADHCAQLRRAVIARTVG
jgi:hypothetical protein